MKGMKKPATIGRANSEQLSGQAHRHRSIEDALSEALTIRGVTDFSICNDGEIQRLDAPDKKRGNLNVWYVVLSHEVAVFGFWHTDEKYIITLRSKYDPVAVERARQAAGRAARKRQCQKSHDESQVAVHAQKIWYTASGALVNHPYLLSKGVGAHRLRESNGELLVPIYANGKLVNLQRINRNGSKRFLKGGLITGAAALVGKVAGAQTVYLCEGWATAATIHEASGFPVVAAMTADNMEPVAKRIRVAFPAGVEIIVAADNDRYKQHNKGYAEGKKAADTILAKLTLPIFSCSGCQCSDFNDLAQCKGAK
ncbi:toprim domain-containing protein [Marinobacter gelidimuriae]|uniref:toprim domain-containing protein n=1 Tax=Marinobacter gelidimuriae TaxID=2739064 RepID=UPI00036457F8|nr:toprim domain-containing protein [Marinobacter gelidimuriae]